MFCTQMVVRFFCEPDFASAGRFVVQNRLKAIFKNGDLTQWDALSFKRGGEKAENSLD